MTIWTKTFLTALIVQIGGALLFLLAGRTLDGTFLNVLNGIFAFIVFTFYLLPLEALKLLVVGQEPRYLPKPVPEMLLCVLVVVYASVAATLVKRLRPLNAAEFRN